MAIKSQTQNEEIQRVVEQTFSIAEEQGALKLRRLILAECRAIKESLVDVAKLPNGLEKLRQAEWQLGALHVLDKMLDILEIK